jgi:hypothetical protein
MRLVGEPAVNEQAVGEGAAAAGSDRGPPCSQPSIDARLAPYARRRRAGSQSPHASMAAPNIVIARRHHVYLLIALPNVRSPETVFAGTRAWSFARYKASLIDALASASQRCSLGRAVSARDDTASPGWRQPGSASAMQVTSSHRSGTPLTAALQQRKIKAPIFLLSDSCAMQ